MATAREELNGQALGNSLYGLQGMSSREPEVRNLLAVLAIKVSECVGMRVCDGPLFVFLINYSLGLFS